jgi:hypothetical protein
MARLILGVLFLWIFILLEAGAVPAEAKKKYPYPLLTDDYSILTGNDLAAYTWGMKPRPFTEKEDSGGYNYWQCFPRDAVSITLKDKGYSTEDIGWKDTLSDLKIEVWTESGVVHHYEMRAPRPFRTYDKEFHTWHKLMKGEKYVCLAGSFVEVTPKTVNGKTIKVYGWIYDKIKTKKGCSAYWDDCGRTYEQYLKHEARLNKWKKTKVWENE